MHFISLSFEVNYGCMQEIYLDSFFRKVAFPILKDHRYQEMKKYVTHGRYTLFDHCFRVSLLAYSQARRKGLSLNYESLIRGCLLHDYYLYDWHKAHEGHKFHGFRHPYFSLRNAERDFSLTRKEKNMILSHMFPFTFWIFPKSREAILLTWADKRCAYQEHHNTFHEARREEIPLPLERSKA